MTAAKLASIPDDQPDPPDRKPKKKNLAAVTGQEAEAKDGYVLLEHLGVTLQIPLFRKIPAAAMDLFRKGDNYGGTQAMVGEEQWELLLAEGMLMEDVDELGKKIQEVTGKLVGLYRLLAEHGDAIEADLQHHYNVDLLDFYRGTMSGRKLEVLIRHLPITSELVTAQNGGRRKWTETEHLIADLWALTVRMNSAKGTLPEDFDHPTRAAITAEAKDKHMAALKIKYQNRKRERARRSQPLKAVEAPE